jgi:flagellar assembly factor FliW
MVMSRTPKQSEDDVTAVLTDIETIETASRDSQGDIITFPRGILGFEECRTFRLERNAEWEPLAKLQSVEQPRLSFVVAPPRLFLTDFCVRIDPLEVAELEIQDVHDAEMWAIVTVPDDPRRMSANLQGPIIVNRANGKGKQVVLTRSHYSTQHPMFADAIV